ncbi:MAG: hypothetical protein ISR45_07175 [Rhodospirillales bacterium]|nr:hypothetical protein [Rhodospirillales bacterium]
MINKPQILASLILTPALFIALAACVSRPMVWHKANSGIDEQRSDLAQCRSYAKREAEREYVHGKYNSSSSDYDTQSTYQKNMDAYQVKKSTKGLLSGCMKLKGYRQVPAEN